MAVIAASNLYPTPNSTISYINRFAFKSKLAGVSDVYFRNACGFNLKSFDKIKLLYKYIFSCSKLLNCLQTIKYLVN